MKRKKHPKKDFRKWSIYFFQIGLVLALFISWRAIEGKTYKIEEISEPIVFNQENFNSTEEIKVFEKPKETPKPKPIPQKKITAKIKKTNKEEDTDFIDFQDLLPSTNTENTNPIAIDSIASLDDFDKEKDIDPVSFFDVQEAPIFPGCEKYKNNNQRKDCLNNEIRKFINRRFNTDLAARLGLSGRIQINAQFTVDESGEIIDIKTRAEEQILAEEATRILHLLPNFQPGKQNDKPVKVIYQLPIIMAIQ